MSVTIFAQNLLETSGALVTTNPAANPSKPASRVFDRDRTLQYEGGVIGQTDLDVDLGGNMPASHWALVNPNITGVTVTLFGDAATIGTTSVDTVAPTATHTLESFSSVSRRYWRVRVPTLTTVAPLIGEVLIGVARVISQNPVLETGKAQAVGNVSRWRSVGGYPWSARHGDKRARYEWVWRGLAEADLDQLLLAFDDAEQGSKNVLVQDQLGVLRWMRWEDEKLVPIPQGAGLFEVAATFEEA